MSKKKFIFADVDEQMMDFTKPWVVIAIQEEQRKIIYAYEHGDISLEFTEQYEEATFEKEKAKFKARKQFLENDRVQQFEQGLLTKEECYAPIRIEAFFDKELFYVSEGEERATEYFF